MGEMITDPKPEHLVEAIFHTCTHLDAISSEDPDYCHVVRRLADLEKTHFKMFGARGGWQKDNAEVVKELHLAVSPQMAVITDRSGLEPHLEVLLSMPNITDLTNIKKGIKYCRLCLTSPHSHLPATLSALGLLLYHLFHLTGNINHLHKSIKFCCNLINMPGVLLNLHMIT